MNKNYSSTSKDIRSVSEATDVRLSITPDLYDALASLIRYAAQVDLPAEIVQAVQVCLTSYEKADLSAEVHSEDSLGPKIDNTVEAGGKDTSFMRNKPTELY
jgi:hypothetical protein